MQKGIHRNSLIRHLLWAVVASGVALASAFFFTGMIDLSARIAGAHLAVLLIVSFLHDQVWLRSRSGHNAGKPFVLWFTGLSGSGKSTIADRVYDYLRGRGYSVTRLDGDTVRSVFPATGFTRDERNEHIRRIGYLASILEKNGISVISSFVSPYAESRDFVRSMCDNFIEVYVATSLSACEARDVKGLYRKARAGQIKNFTGLDDPYEAPVRPELVIQTEKRSVDESTADVISFIESYFKH